MKTVSVYALAAVWTSVFYPSFQAGRKTFILGALFIKCKCFLINLKFYLFILN